MKKEIGMWAIIAVLVFALIFSTQKAGNMAIDFTDTQGQGINFGEIVVDVNPKSYSFWLDIDTVSGTHAGYVMGKSAGTDVYISSVSSTIAIIQAFSGDLGYWRAPTNEILAGNRYHVVITYDNSATSNDPIIYINGSSVTITEVSTPTGSADADSGDFYLGGKGTLYSFDGRLPDARIYNRILTAAEVLQIYNARGRDNIRNGLVFCPFLIGAKGLQAFDGATLAAGNTIVDPCSGAYGVPAGNPVGVGETYLR